jgi:hypothetical protein
MSAAEVIAEISALSPAEQAQVVQQSLDRLDPEILKLVERKLRRLLHPDVPEEIWEGYEDAEDGRFVDMEMILNEEPPTP